MKHILIPLWMKYTRNFLNSTGYIEKNSELYRSIDFLIIVAHKNNANNREKLFSPYCCFFIVLLYKNNKFFFNFFCFSPNATHNKILLLSGICFCDNKLITGLNYICLNRSIICIDSNIGNTCYCSVP